MDGSAGALSRSTALLPQKKWNSSLRRMQESVVIFMTATIGSLLLLLFNSSNNVEILHLRRLACMHWYKSPFADAMQSLNRINCLSCALGLAETNWPGGPVAWSMLSAPRVWTTCSSLLWATWKPSTCLVRIYQIMDLKMFCQIPSLTIFSRFWIINSSPDFYVGIYIYIYIYIC